MGFPLYVLQQFEMVSVRRPDNLMFTFEIIYYAFHLYLFEK